MARPPQLEGGPPQSDDQQNPSRKPPILKNLVSQAPRKFRDGSGFSSPRSTGPRHVVPGGRTHPERGAGPTNSPAPRQVSCLRLSEVGGWHGRSVLVVGGAGGAAVAAPPEDERPVPSGIVPVRRTAWAGARPRPSLVPTRALCGRFLRRSRPEILARTFGTWPVPGPRATGSRSTARPSRRVARRQASQRRAAAAGDRPRPGGGAERRACTGSARVAAGH